jgi:hypothetical protein
MTATAKSITQEAKYIIGRARANDARVVTLGVLVFFSTASGDAWALDTEDSLALCLAFDGEEQPFYVGGNEEGFEIGWNGSFVFDGDTFVIHSNSGDILEVDGYPVAEILLAIHQSQGQVPLITP